MPSSPRSLSFSRTSHPRGEFQGQHLTRSPWWMPIGHEDHLGAHDARFPHSLVAGIEDEIGIGFLEKPSGQGTEGDIETRVDAADARDRKRVPTECFGDRMHLAGREPLHLYIPAKAASTACGSRSNHAVWRACSDPRNQKLELPDPRQPATFVVARPVALTAPPPARGDPPQKLGHLGLEQLLESFFHQGFHGIPVFDQESFSVGETGARLLDGHGRVPPKHMGALQHHPSHAMTTSTAREFAHQPVHSPRRRPLIIPSPDADGYSRAVL